MRNHVSPQAIYKPSIQNKLEQPDTQFNSEFESTTRHFLTGIKFHVEPMTFLFTSQIKNKSKEGKVIK